VANSGLQHISVLTFKGDVRLRLSRSRQEPAAARISPDNKTLVVANRRANSVSLFDPATRRRPRKFSRGCTGASGCRHLPDIF